MGHMLVLFCFTFLFMVASLGRYLELIVIDGLLDVTGLHAINGATNCIACSSTMPYLAHSIAISRFRLSRKYMAVSI